jgi:hypothetical protein
MAASRPIGPSHHRSWPAESLGHLALGQADDHAVGRPRHGLAGLASVGPRRDRAAEVLQAVERVHRAPGLAELVVTCPNDRASDAVRFPAAHGHARGRVLG